MYLIRVRLGDTYLILNIFNLYPLQTLINLNNVIYHRQSKLKKRKNSNGKFHTTVPAVTTWTFDTMNFIAFIPPINDRSRRRGVGVERIMWTCINMILYRYLIIPIYLNTYIICTY